MARTKKRTTVRIENLTAKVEELEAQAREDLRKREPFLKEMEECSKAKEFHLHLAELHFRPESLRELATLYENSIQKSIDAFEKNSNETPKVYEILRNTAKQFFADMQALIKMYETLKLKN